MRRFGLLSIAAFVLLAALPVAPAHAASTGPFEGLGTWVDVFDYAPRLRTNGEPPPVTADSVDDMAALGVRTLYVQVANPDAASADHLTDTKQLKAILDRAHERKLEVVAWYLPSLADPKRDDAMLRRIYALRSGRDRVDGIGLDIESTDVADIALRNARAVAFTRKARELVGNSMPLAAIVYPAVQLETLNPVLWPTFPYKKLAPYVDVWMPMAYYTYRSEESGLRSAYKYSVHSVTLLRKRLGDDHAPVHLIGGIADASTVNDYLGLRQAARDLDAVGWSLYDYVTTSSAAWPYLGANG